MAEEHNSNPSSPSPMETRLREFLAGELSDQQQQGTLLMMEAFKSSWNKDLDARLEAMDDRLSSAGPRTSPRPHAGTPLHNAGTSNVPHRRHGKDPLYPSDSRDPLDSFVGDMPPPFARPSRPLPPRQNREPMRRQPMDPLEEMDYVEEPNHPPVEDFYGEDEGFDEMPNAYPPRHQTNRGQGNGNSNRRDVKIRIEPFSGECDPEKYLEWEVMTESILDHLGYEEHEKVEVVTLHFTGQARSWWFRN